MWNAPYITPLPFNLFNRKPDCALALKSQEFRNKFNWSCIYRFRLSDCHTYTQSGSLIPSCRKTAPLSVDIAERTVRFF